VGEQLTERRRYRKAPIIEATISLGVVTPATLTVADLDVIGELEKDRYTGAGNEPYANSVVGVEALLLQNLHEAVAFHALDRFDMRLFLSKLKEVILHRV